MAHTISLFREAAGMQVGLYNGPAHRGYPTGFKNGIPYFLSSSPGLGTVVYNGVAYPQVRLLYDLVQDEVIVEREADGVQINLLREKTTAFTLHGHTFVFFSPDSAAVAGVAAGFYDQLYRGQVSVLARRVNRLQERTVQSGVERTVRQRVRYYLRKDGHYHPIKSRGALLGHLKEHRKAVQANLRESGIRYGEDPEAAMVRMAAYYDQLTRRP